MPIRRNHAAGINLRGTLFPISVGLCLSQIVATAIVHHSNQKIWDMAQAIASSGYLSIPTGPALEVLTQFSSAFWGGLFFTLSIGTGLTLASWSAIYLWSQVFQRNRKLLMALVIAWLILLVWNNLVGPAWLPSFFCLLIPPATAWATARGLHKEKVPPSRLWTIPAITLAVLTALWATQFNRQLFITIRDHILLSNPVGHKVNDFYYRYTLYAAEVFKPLNKKTIRTYRWRHTTDSALTQKIDNQLSRHDTLRIQGTATPNLILTLQDGELVLTSADGFSLQTTPAKLFANTSGLLNRYSKLTDRLTPLRFMPDPDSMPGFIKRTTPARLMTVYASLIRWSPFRNITFFGLLLGFPVLMYVTIYSVLRSVADLWLGEKKAVMTASGICMTVGILLWLPMLSARPFKMSSDNIAFALETDSWPQRVAALQYIEQKKIDISRYPQYRSLVRSPLVVERYWLARAMATSRSISTYTHLTTMLKDPHPNVVCQAYYALGQSRKPGAIQQIYHQLKTSDHWYTQGYGYRAMRRLGWQQKRLK